jgi:hypothetical protein
MPRPKNPPDRVNPWRLFVGAMVPNWLLERPELSLGAKLVYGRLAQYAGRRGYAYPRVTTLARAVGLKDKRQAQRYLKELREHGLLEVADYSKNGAANRYFFLNHRWMYEDEVPETTPETDGDLYQEENDQEIASDSDKVDGPGDIYDTGGVSHTTPTPRQIRHPIEESQGKESEEVNQGGAKRHLGSKLHSAGLVSPGAAGNETSRDLCAKELSSSAVPQQSTIADLEAAAEGAKAKHDAAAAIAAAKKQANAAKRKRARRSAWHTGEEEQKIQKVNGKKLTPLQSEQLRVCERMWIRGMRKSWPDTTFDTAWDGKQRKQCIHLLEKYPGELVEQAISYVIVQWDAIRDRIFKGKGTFPSIGMLLRMHEVLVPESQKFSQALAVHHEYEGWFDANPHKLVAPQELQARYDAMKPDLKALGILD